MTHRSSRALRNIRNLLETTPDIRKPDTWWPLGDDSAEFKRGARWAENWWRIKISEAIEQSEPTHPSDTPTCNEREALVREARVWAALIGTKPLGARELFNRLACALESTLGAAQGEPSDAQVIAALNAKWNYDPPYPDLTDWADESISQMRAALRASASVNQEGTNSV